MSDATTQNEYEITELNRRVSNLIRIGVVEQFDAANAMVRIRIGGTLTTWLAWLTHRAGDDISWHAPDIGEQVMVLAPSGELSQAVVLKGLYQNSNPPPVNDPNKHHIRYKDGAVIEYDRATHHLKAILPAGATTELVSTGGLTIEATDGVLINAASGGVRIIGDLEVIGSIDATENIHSSLNVIADINTVALNVAIGNIDCIGGGVSLVGHTHAGVSGETSSPL